MKVRISYDQADIRRFLNAVSASERWALSDFCEVLGRDLLDGDDSAELWKSYKNSPLRFIQEAPASTKDCIFAALGEYASHTLCSIQG